MSLSHKYVTLEELVETDYPTDSQRLLNSASAMSLADIAIVLPEEILESQNASNYSMNGKLAIIKRQLEATLEYRNQAN